MNLAESNRQNAMKSTGPVSTEGKAASAKNAVKHGCYAAASEAVPILGEDPVAFESLHAGLVESIQPVGALEHRLVERISSLLWRLQRVVRAGREGFEYLLRPELQRNNLQAFTNGAHAAFYLAMAVGDGKYQERLERHEVTLERSLHRNLHELERVQARRQGQSVNPPMVVDVNLSMVD